MFKRLMYLFSFILVLGLTTTFAKADISDGLVAYWPLDEGTGTTTADLSGNGNNGTLLGAPTWGTGKLGGALDFDGVDDAVDCGPAPELDFGTGDFSVSAWVKTSVEPAGKGTHVFQKGDDDFENWNMEFRSNDGGDISLEIENGTDYKPHTNDAHATNLIDGQWHHIVIMRKDSTKLRIYVDGLENINYGGPTTIPADLNINTSTGPAFIGANYDKDKPAGENFFAGMIDDVAVWNRALTAEEVTYLWNNGDGNTTALPEPEKASDPNPADRATVDLTDAIPLSWTPGETADQHDVYLGTSFEDVNNVDISDTTGIYKGRQNLILFTPAETVELGQTYYWRIDEVEADNTTVFTGKVWSFTISEFLTVDDFEGYNAGENEIWWTWKDGLGYTAHDNEPAYPGNGTGSAVGDENTNSFTEESIVHGGLQSMPYWYNNNKQGFLTYSEATKTLTDTRDWTQQGIKALSLWFRGFPPFLGGFVEAPAGTFTMSAEGADIWGSSDEFHFAWQELSGAGEIIVKVESVENTHPWAKAGIMIRDTLDPDSAFAMVAITPGNGVWFGRRTGGDTSSDTQADITAPQWIKLGRSIGGLARASYSSDGINWTPLGASEVVIMNNPMYIGLALTSHEPAVACEAVFSSVTSNGTGLWVNQDIGLNSNEAEPMYVSISNNNGTMGTVYYDDNQNIDPNATLIDTWTEWNIDLKDFLDQGVDLSDVNSITIGIGDKDDPQPGGSGKMFFDDIRLYQPRYVPGKAKPLRADFTGDGIVNDDDLEIMLNDWLLGDFTRPGPLLVHYKFDEGTGTVVSDSSGQDSDGTFSGTATWTAEGKMGAAASFDGGVGEVRGNSPYLNGLDAMSFGAWIKSNAVDTDTGFIIFANPTGNDQRGIRYDLAGSNGGGTNVMKYGVATEEGSYEIESSVNVQTTEWQHVMVTWTSGEATKLYVNGVLDTPSSTDDVIGGTTIGYTDVIVGRGGKDANGSWDGLVDDFRVYEVALTAQQVQTVMNGGDIPVVDVYVPLTSVANIYDEEPANSKQVNEKDRAILDEEWLQVVVWPEW